LHTNAVGMPAENAHRLIKDNNESIADKQSCFNNKFFVHLQIISKKLLTRGGEFDIIYKRSPRGEKMQKKTLKSVDNGMQDVVQ
jgi:hypothetical protein